MKTAVELAFEELNNWRIKNLGEHAIIGIPNEVVQKAIKRFEQQIINSHLDGCETGEMFNNENRAFITDSEQYYNKTFKTK